jgi:hypothetical protein
MLDSSFGSPAVVWGVLLLIAMAVAAFAGQRFHRYLAGRRGQDTEYETQEGYTVSSVVTLLIFMVGFTFAIAADRFEARRQLVVDDALAIEELYLKAQILDEPHRSNISNILTRYADNHILLAQERRADRGTSLAENERLEKELWIAVMAGFQTVRGIDFSSAFVDSANRVVEMNSARIAARNAQIPDTVFVLLYIYAIATALMFGYVLKGRPGRISGIALLALCTLSIMLLVDLNQPVSGAIRESQVPMERLSWWMHSNPSASFGQPAIPESAKQ